LSKEEVVLKLKQERNNRINAERREKYWRRFENECYRKDDEDNADLSMMLQNVTKEKMPGERACLWERQKKIIQTETKHGYRWHPR